MTGPNEARPHSHAGPDDILATADLCTKCGVCQAQCPVVAVTDAFPGPKYAGPQAQRFRDAGAEFDRSFDLCTGCGICTSVCPNGVEVADIITIARSRKTRAGAIGLAQWLVNRPDAVGKYLGLAPALSNAILQNQTLRRAAEALTGISSKAPLPAIAGRAFRAELGRYPAASNGSSQLIYFPGCAVEYYDPETGVSVMRLLRALGFSPQAVEGCCSLPMLSSGEWSAAQFRASRLLHTLAARTGDRTTIVTSSTSCGLTLKSKYAAFLSLHDEQFRKVASAARDVCEFLREETMDRLQTELRPMRKRVFYHAPCQLRGHGIGNPALELLQSIPDLEIVVSEAGCCGIGGTYGYAAERHDISVAIARPLVDQFNDADPDWIVCDSETCRWHLAAMSGRPAIHPIRVLWESLRKDSST